MNRRIPIRILSAAAAVLSLGGCLFQSGDGEGRALTTFSMPKAPGSDARSDAGSSDGTLMELPAYGTGDRIIRHSGFILSYDAAKKLPKWVAYELTAEETGGDAERDELIFKMDPAYKDAGRIITTPAGPRAIWPAPPISSGTATRWKRPST